MDIKELLKRREEAENRTRIMEIVSLIEQGDWDSEKFPKEDLFDTMGQPREAYKNPEERDSYNYGYMTDGEFNVSNPNAE